MLIEPVLDQLACGRRRFGIRFSPQFSDDPVAIRSLDDRERRTFRLGNPVNEYSSLSDSVRIPADAVSLGGSLLAQAFA